MGHDLRHFCGEGEIWRGLLIPAIYCRHRRGAVVVRINFDGIELGGVETQIVAGLHSIQIERTRPTVRGECGRA